MTYAKATPALIRKSTLTLQLANGLAASGRSVLVISGEESASQVRLRAERLGTLRVFEVPLDARSLGLVVEHPAGFSPGRLILFDEQSWLHPPTVFRLAP